MTAITPRRLIVALLAAVMGYGLLAFLFRHQNPAAQWNVTLDREAAVAQARELARQQGLTVADWEVFTRSRRRDDVERCLAVEPALRGAAFFSPVAILVVLRHGEESFRVRFDADGRVSARIHRSPSEGRRPPPEVARRVAAAAFRELTQAAARPLGGTEGGQHGYRALAPEDRGQDAVLFAWERTPPELPAATVRVEVLARETGAEEVRVRIRFADEFTDRVLWPGRDGTGGLRILIMVLSLFVFLAVVIFFVTSLARGEGLRAAPLVAGAAGSLYVMVQFLATFRYRIPGEFFGTLTPAAGVQVLLNAFLTVAFGLLWLIPTVACLGAGRVAARRVSPAAIASLELLLTGRLLSRPPAAAILFGLLLGGLVASVPHLVVAGGVFSSAWIPGHGPRLLTLPATWLPWPVVAVEPLVLLALFGFLAPQLDQRLKSGLLSRLLTVVLAAGWLSGNRVEMPLIAALLVGALLAILYDQIYRHFDLLTVLVAAAAGKGALNVLVVLAQPSEPLRRAGIYGLAAGGLLLTAALAVALRGKVAAVDFSRENARPRRTQRERMQAEMQIARRAQIGMLPRAVPEIANLSIAAVCDPAREVGGDLYDFLRLPDGRWGIAVGDVSGKGMGAAYYMALTKGLLSGAAEGRAAPIETLGQVNRALYEISARDVFVTMFYGVLDPPTGTLTFVRAGHNPVLWRRAESGEILLPCPPGIALGANAGPLFERTLRAKQIDLEPGDALFFYSDGITEAMNERHEEYGEDRLLQAVARTDGLDAERSRDLILEDVASFVGQAPPHDDITLVVLRVLPSNDKGPRPGS